MAVSVSLTIFYLVLLYQRKMVGPEMASAKRTGTNAAEPIDLTRCDFSQAAKTVKNETGVDVPSDVARNFMEQINSNH